jgi:hypothetical protein
MTLEMQISKMERYDRTCLVEQKNPRGQGSGTTELGQGLICLNFKNVEIPSPPMPPAFLIKIINTGFFFFFFFFCGTGD